MNPPGSVRFLDEHLHGDRQWLQLTMLRFLTHDRLARVFPDYLIGVYHGMRTAIPLMEAALARSTELAPDCPVAAGLVDYWAHHIREESGHSDWMLDDLRYLGFDVRRLAAEPPPAGTAELIGTLHFWIRHTHPVAALSYFHVVEGQPPSVEQLDWMVESAGIPRPGLETFYRHARIDIAHARELSDLIDALPLTEAHLGVMKVSGTTALRQLARIIEGHIADADRADRQVGRDSMARPEPDVDAVSARRADVVIETSGSRRS